MHQIFPNITGKKNDQILLTRGADSLKLQITVKIGAYEAMNIIHVRDY